MNLQTPLAGLSKVGKKTEKLLAKLGLITADDLLYYFPFRYEDFRKTVPIAELRVGEMVTVKARVELIGTKRSFKSKKMITECLVSDDSGSLRIVWFNQPYITKSLQSGDIVFFSGKVTRDMLGPQMVSPMYEKEHRGEQTHTARLVPIYPLTQGLTEKQVRFLVSQIIPLAKTISEWLPNSILEEYDLPPLSQALHGIHFPHDEIDLKNCTERLKFDELILIQLQAELSRLKKIIIHAPEIIFKEMEIKQFVSALPFTLTPAQKLAAWEIIQDMAKTVPMNRLLSGDVGSGKTIVAGLAMYDAFLNNFQSVVMVPTEILARQHFETLTKLLEGYGLKVGLYTRTQRLIKESENSSKKQMLEAIQRGELQVIIGTQSLLSDGVEFKKLGLVIVDEQHRFGVEQRRIIKEKGHGAHFLSMTATPIPRSLALMIYGDLDVSLINQLPPGRKKITTRLVETNKRDQAYQFICEQVNQGRQVFVICPLIEKPDTGDQAESLIVRDATDDKKTVMSEYKKLSETIFPDLKVGFVHGKLKPDEKEEVMKKFTDNEISILVSTSVVEVGVNIPNATVMMIEGADRFGLAQLHQFRGRVGRSDHQSYCFLFTDSFSKKVAERLKFFEQCHDGFKLAEKDLEIRGPGEVYGREQSGMMQLRLATLTDTEIIKKAREAAHRIVPDLEKYPKVLEKMKKWKEEVHLE
jgi:ATP-dependent DNA helicase RecG